VRTSGTERKGAAWLRAVAALAAAALLVVAATGCGAKRKAAEEKKFPTSEARYRFGMELLAKRKLTKAKANLSRVDLFSAEDRAQLEPMVRLALADTEFYRGNDIALIDARALYLDFVTLYGDHPLAPYAQYQAGVCSLGQVNDPSRDQTQTLRAIDDLREVVRRYPQSPFSAAARLSIRTADSNLAAHEVIVGRFYEKKKNWLAATDRYREVLDTYPDYADLDEVYYRLGHSLMRMDNDVEARIYLSKLVDDYPETDYAAKARDDLQKIGDDATDGAGGGGQVSR